jgi:hypothetical protein
MIPFDNSEFTRAAVTILFVQPSKSYLRVLFLGAVAAFSAQALAGG